MSVGFVARMARRESRGGATRRRLLLLTGAVAAGVAALVAVNSFAANLRAAVTVEARALLGADLALSSGRTFPARAQALLDTLVTPGADSVGRVARMVSFVGMAYVPRTAGVRLVQVAAVEPGYPFYGEIRTDPAGIWPALQLGGKVLVDPSLLAALDARVGDTLALGDGRFAIGGSIISQPGAVAAATAFSPRIFIAARDLESTNLLRFGSQADYEAFVLLPDPGSADRLAKRYRPVLRPERVRIRSVEENRDDLTEALTQLSNYLGLIALVALLLGGLGVASAVHVFLRQKLDTIAVLRCLGATWGGVFAVYLLQATAMGALGSVVGAALGIALQQVLPSLLQDLLPVNVHASVAPSAILLGIGLGLWVAVVFALRPLLAIRDVSPLMTLRRDFEPVRRRREPLRWLANGALAASVFGLAVVQAGNLADGAAFTGGIGVALLVLWLASLGLIKAVRRWFPTRWPYLWRQGLANLYRPANQTVTVVVSLGFGAFLLCTVLLVQHNLLRDLLSTAPSLRPNLVFFEIQSDQKDGVVEAIRATGVEPQPPVALVPMRIRSVKGELVRIAPASDTTGGEGGEGGNRENSSGPSGGGWAFRREYRSTYRDTVVTSEKVVRGEWWRGPATDSTAPVDVSLEVDIAEELGVTIGDEIVWDVQGATVPSRVASLREVDWARFEPNFFAVFRGGALDRAPQTFATLVRLDDPARRGALQRRIAERYPNVTSVDLGTVQVAIEGILDRVVLAIRFMAGFSLATGAIVLVGAIATTRFQRLREAVLLKTLGATRAQVLRVVLAEYLALGTLASGMALLLAIAAGWALARYMFEANRFALPLPSVLGLAATVIGLTVVIGLWNSADILRRPPLEALRND
jgi:putative ABC transport system permease protein